MRLKKTHESWIYFCPFNNEKESSTVPSCFRLLQSLLYPWSYIHKVFSTDDLLFSTKQPDQLRVRMCGLPSPFPHTHAYTEQIKPEWQQKWIDIRTLWQKHETIPVNIHFSVNSLTWITCLSLTIKHRCYTMSIGQIQSHKMSRCKFSNTWTWIIVC